MARRRNTGLVEDLMDMVALLPWWGGVLLALVLYLLLHQFASIPAPAATRPDQISSAITQTFWRSLAIVGQYALPIICLCGAAVSAWRRYERKTLIATVTKSPAANVLDGMTWREFERLVGEAFRLKGYAVRENGGGGADGGVDLMLEKDGDMFLVQCKQWRAYKVGVDIVRALYGVMTAKGAAGGFVVTSGEFTDAAREFANGRNVELINGNALHELIRSARSAPAAAQPPARGATASTPNCPACGKPMVKRTAKHGSYRGNEFWGCSGYPSCHGKRSIG